MSPSPPAAVLDPLSEPHERHSPPATSLATGIPLATTPRTDRTAPDVTAIHGAQAVAIVRAAGLIAAIESVPSDLAEGTVIDQDPPPGARLEREGVVTLRLATPPDPVALASENEPGLSLAQAPRTAGPDDTEEWFRALAPSAPADPTSARRRRKHRRATRVREQLFDPSPAPLLERSEPAARFASGTLREAALRPSLTWTVTTLAPLLAGLHWRRAGTLLAGVLLLALIGARLFTTGDRRAASTKPRTLLPTTGVNTPTRDAVGATRPSAPRRVRRSLKSAGRRRIHTHARPRSRHAPPVAVVATHPADRPATGTPPAPSTAAQFVYLGQ